ncbi:MAG: ZIP family metal transporter [Bacteroidota bacterium]
MHLSDYLILFFSVLLGGGTAFYFQRNNKNILQLVLSFSGSFILGISVLHLMPVAFSEKGNAVGLLILFGFFVQLLLEQLSRGVEHGHIHKPHHRRNSFALQVLLGLCIHAFFEGIPLTNDEVHAHHHHHHLLWGIILHKAPAAFALVLLLMLSGVKESLIWIGLLVFAAMSPFGALVGEGLKESGFLTPQRQNYIVAFVVGSFLHIATTILFETDSSGHHQLPLKKMLAVIAGSGMAMLTLI